MQVDIDYYTKDCDFRITKHGFMDRVDSSRFKASGVQGDCASPDARAYAHLAFDSGSGVPG